MAVLSHLTKSDKAGGSQRTTKPFLSSAFPCGGQHDFSISANLGCLEVEGTPVKNISSLTEGEKTVLHVFAYLYIEAYVYLLQKIVDSIVIACDIYCSDVSQP